MCSVVTRWPVTRQAYAKVLRMRACSAAQGSVERSWDSRERAFRWQNTRGNCEGCHVGIQLLGSAGTRTFSVTLITVFWLNFQNVSRSKTSHFTISVWNVTFCFSVFFKEHPIDNNLGDLYIPWATLCSLSPLPSPLPTRKHLHLLFSRILLHIPVFVRLLYFLVATISPFFQSQPQALPTREWHQTTCQEPFKIAARLQGHS